MFLMSLDIFRMDRMERHKSRNPAKGAERGPRREQGYSRFESIGVLCDLGK